MSTKATPLDVLEGRAQYSVIQGDCLEVVRSIPDESIDSMVTDPPSGISFMGADWDDDKGGGEQWIAWLTERLREALRVLRPGGHVCVWSLPRTSHWTGTAIERAGFEVRDTIHHTFGCLSDDTEILINGHWKSYRDIAAGDLALCYNADNGTLSWGAIEELFTYDYNDTAFRISGAITDQIVTREHRCPIERDGGTVFVRAEEAARELTARVPVLESVQALLEAVSVQHQGAGNPEQVLFTGLHQRHAANRENREVSNQGCNLLGVRKTVQAQEFDVDVQGQVLLHGVRRDIESGKPGSHGPAEEDREHGSRWVDSSEYGELSGKDVREHESGLERRGDILQKARELQANQVCQVPGWFPGNVQARRVRDGAQVGGRNSDRETVTAPGDRASCGPRPTEQLNSEPDAVPYQCGPQAVRAHRFTTTELVRFEPLPYHGTVWCVRVATGAFVARRNGKAFITGNSGFPKSMNVSLAIDKADGLAGERQIVHSYSAGGNAGTSTKDKGGTYSVGAENSAPVQLSVSRGATEKSREWDGFGTALKPGHEVWWIARKPFKGTLVENVLQHGCGAINIDACRVATDWNEADRPESWRKSAHTADADADKIAAPPGEGIQCHPGGRWPANVVFTHSAGCTDAECSEDCPLLELFRQSGVSESSGGTRSAAPNFKNQVYGTGFGGPVSAANQHADSGSAARFFNTFEWHPELDDPFIYLAKPSTAEREAGCGRLPRKSAGELVKREDGKPGTVNGRSGAGGGSSGRHNHHPTLKSIALMSHLIRLVTRPGGVTLSMFLGSGTDVCAAIQSGIRVIGIELNPDFAEIAEARALYWSHNTATPKKPIASSSKHQMSLFGEINQ